MKLTINAPESHLQDMLDHVGLQLERGMTSGHVGQGTYWDSGDDFADAPTPEQVVEEVIRNGYAGASTFEFAVEQMSLTAHQIRNLMILAAREARK